jgi:hypothetical protein
MKTLYITQDWLDELGGNGSPGNPGSGGNGCESVCANASPNSAAYALCGCGPVDEEPGASIKDPIPFILVIIAAVAIIIGINRYLEHRRAVKLIKNNKAYKAYNRSRRRKKERQIMKDLNRKK